MKNNLINHIENILKELQIETYSIGDDNLSVSSSFPTGLKFHLHLHESKIDFYYSLRTSSWTYSGERSDLHDIISIAFSAFLKYNSLKISCSLINIVNPVDPALDNEIYARYIIPIQYDSSAISSEDSLKKFCERLVIEMFIFEYLFWELTFQLNEEIDIKKMNYSFELKDDFKNSIVGLFNKQESLNVGVRDFPMWEYVSDTKKGLSIVKSERLAFYFSTFGNTIDKKNLIEGINGKLLLTKEYKNLIPNANINNITHIFEKFKDNLNHIIPLENKIICVGNKITVIIDCFCDFQAYKTEKELIKQRHLKESRLLFPPEEIVWAEKIDDDRFELLIKSLLERQEQINWVRRVGHVNEPDGGRDLIAEWLIKPTGKERRIRGEYPNKIKRIIIQCKGYKNGVGKSDITDIRDTIEHNDCDGYFLAVSSYLRRSLTEHLEKMRYSGRYWIDWWTRDEIESKLIENIDILKKFSDIVIIKN